MNLSVDSQSVSAALVALGELTAAAKHAFTVAEFCALNGISRATFWRMKQRGIAPTLMRVGRTIRISAEAASAWRREREAA